MAGIGAVRRGGAQGLRAEELRHSARLQAVVSGGLPLCIGSRGEGVVVLQAVLHGLGYALPRSMRTGQADGDYREETANAVSAFQFRYRLVVDGITGPEVLHKLDALLLVRRHATGPMSSPPTPFAAAPSSTAVAIGPLRRRGYDVVPDAGDRELQGPGATGLPPALASVPTDPVFARVHAEATRCVRQLCRETRKVLTGLGCGDNRSLAAFNNALKRVFTEIARVRETAGELDTLTSTRDGDKRRHMIEEVVRSLGGTDVQGRAIADHVLTGFDGRRTPGFGLTNAPTTADLMRSFFWASCALHDRLGTLKQRTREPYRGTLQNPRPGIEQTLGLLEQFPDLAGTIYEAAGLSNLDGFPPRVTGSETNLRGQRFVDTATAWAERRRRQQTVRAAGLFVAGIALGLISLGTMSVVTATLVGGGFGLAMGVANVASTSAAHRRTLDAYAIGAASPESVQLSAARLRGAWIALSIDIVTMGAMARVGGASNTGRIAQFLRVQIINGTGTALSTAADPDVMRSGNAAAIILFATALGVAADGTSDVAISRFARRVGSGVPVQVAYGNPEQPLRVGSVVRVAAGEGELPLSAKIISLDPTGNRLVLQLDDGGHLSVRVDRVGRLELDSGGRSSVTSPHTLPRGVQLSKGDVAGFGLDPELATSMQRYAAANDLVIQVRGGSPASMTQRNDANAFPKPYDMKAKSINQQDVQLGIGRPQDIGLVAHALPDIRPGQPGWSSLDAALQERAMDRIEWYRDHNAGIQRLVTDGGWRRTGAYQRERYRVRIDEHGVLRDEQGRPFAGDVDLFYISHADGTPLDRAERVRHTRALMDLSGAAVQHVGLTPDWVPSTRGGIADRRRSMTSHGPDGTKNLLEIRPDGFFTGHGPDPNTYQPYRGR